MDKLKINLIPPEVKEKAKKEAKRTVISRVSVGLLGGLILLTSGVLSMTVYQSVSLRNLNSEIDQEKTKISALKENEAVIFFLKNRIDSVNTFAPTQYTQSELFDLITSLFPEGVGLTSLQIDKSNKVVLQGETGDTDSLDTFFGLLKDPNSNEGKISSILVDSLSKNPEGVIRFSLTLSLQ